jgi:hypothetical protein
MQMQKIAGLPFVSNTNISCPLVVNVRTGYFASN